MSMLTHESSRFDDQRDRPARWPSLGSDLALAVGWLVLAAMLWIFTGAVIAVAAWLVLGIMIADMARSPGQIRP